jgi:hypothetical protein
MIWSKSNQLGKLMRKFNFCIIHTQLKDLFPEDKNKILKLQKVMPVE